MRKIKKKALVILTVVGLLTGSMSVLAVSDDSTDSPEDPVYEISDGEDEGVLCDDGYIEYIEYPSDDELVGMEINIGEIAYPDSSGTINSWSISSGSSGTSGIFKAYNGGTIGVAVTVSPASKTVKVGIVQPDGTRRYVRGSAVITHNFELTQSGNYKVYIENISDVTITASGSFLY